MRLPIAAAALTLLTTLAHAGSWTFKDAKLSIARKAEGAVGAAPEKLDPSHALSTPMTLRSGDTLKLSITATEDGGATKPHQAFLTIQDSTTGAEDAFPINIKDTGKGKLDLTHKDLPVQFLNSAKPLAAHIIIGSFGSSTPFDQHVFDLQVSVDEGTPLQQPEASKRYGKLAEIHHIFRSDPKSPPAFISLIFVFAALITVPILFGIWANLGANLNHLPEALGSAPISHAVFLGSVLGLEGIFFLYYTHWRLYRLLPAAGAVGVIAFLSGSRALSEVQDRRLVGKR